MTLRLADQRKCAVDLWADAQEGSPAHYNLRTPKSLSFFEMLHEPLADLTLLWESTETFAPELGYNSIEVTQMIHSRPSFIRLSLAALQSSAIFAQRANERQGYAPASEKNRRL
jgi:hypothetical protein